MLFKSYLLNVAAFAAVTVPVTADVLSKQDMTAMAAAFDKIFTGIDATMIKVNGFTGDAAGVDAIIKEGDMIVESIISSTAAVKKSVGMGIADLLNIFGPVFVMESKVGELVDGLKVKKADIEKAGGAPKILSLLQREKQAADGLVTVIIANLPIPSLVGIVANPIAKIITDRIGGGIKDWGGAPLPAGTAPKASTPPKASTAPKSPAKGSAPKGKGTGGTAAAPAAAILAVEEETEEQSLTAETIMDVWQRVLAEVQKAQGADSS
jgi:hypothetical protein